MRKNFFILLLIMFFFSSCEESIYRGTIKIYNNWTNWKDLSDDYDTWHMYGDYDDITFKNNYGEILFRFKITPGQTFYKNTKEWTEYSGTMEYYVSDNHPTINEIFASCHHSYSSFYTVIRPFLSSKYGKVKRTAKATIWIAPYKKHPKRYSILFDDVGFGFYMGSYYFPKSSWVKQFDKQKLQKSNYYKQQNEIYE